MEQDMGYSWLFTLVGSPKAPVGGLVMPLVGFR